MDVQDQSKPAAADDQSLLIERLRAMCDKRQLSQGAAARGIGVSAATLSQFVSGKYTGDVGGVADKVRRWLGSIEAGEQVLAMRASEPGWIRTPTADTIYTLLLQAQHEPGIVVVASMPGCGKTVTAQAYRLAAPNVWIITCTPVMETPRQALQQIAVTVGAPIRAPYRLMHDIGERLTDTGGLLIFDEAQHLNRNVLDTIRSLFDIYKVGVALLGNEGLYGASMSKSGQFAQFYSRISARRRFGKPSQADVDQLLAAWGIAGEPERRFLSKVAELGGGLRGVTVTIKQAMVMAGADGAVTARHLQAAWDANK